MASKRGGSNSARLISLFLMAAAFIAIVILNRSGGDALPSPLKKAEGDTGFLVSYDNNKNVNFYCCGNKIFYATKDSMQLIDMNNDTVWADTFSLNTPYLVTEGGIVGVSEQKSAFAYIYDIRGLKYTVDTVYPILGFSVNENGYAAFIFHTGSSYNLNVYDNQGKLTAEYVYAEQNVMPLSCDISDDNRILSVSFLDINDIKINSRIIFYYINKNEAQNTEGGDGFFSSYVLSDMTAGIGFFMEDNKFISVSEKEINFFDVENKGNNARKNPFALNNKLKLVEIINKKNIAVVYGEAYNDRNSAKKQNRIEWLDTNGNIVKSYQNEKNITYLKTGFSSVIIGCDRDYAAYGLNGRSLWSYKSLQDVKYIQFLESQNTVLLAGPSEARIIRMKRDKYMQDISLDGAEAAPAPDGSEEGGGGDDDGGN